MFAFGASLGGACGYAAGAQARGDGVAAPGDEELKPSGDFELDELRRLAVKAPIEELIQHRKTMLVFMSRTYRSDKFLWQGAKRIADYLLNTPSYSERRIASLSLIQLIEKGDRKFAASLDHYIPELRKVK
jgi:hypothetical protein